MSSNLLWLPVLFMIHDFEELIMVPPWINAHASSLSKQKNPVFGGINNSAILSVGVCEEFLMLIVISLYSMWQQAYAVYIGFFVLYLIHLFFHIFLCMKWRTYVPGCITAILQIPICLYLLKDIYLLLNKGTISVITTIIVCFFIGIINLILIHRLMNFISKKQQL